MESRSVVRDGVSITRMGHPTAPYTSLDGGPSCPIDLGEPLAHDLPVEIGDEITPPKIS